MELLRETAPLLIGMSLPLLLVALIRPTCSGQMKFLVTFLSALALGTIISMLAGELYGGFAEGLIAVMIDTSLVYCGSQLSYRLVWKPVVDARLRQALKSKSERVRRVP